VAFTQRPNHLMTHFSECSPVVKRRMTNLTNQAHFTHTCKIPKTTTYTAVYVMVSWVFPIMLVLSLTMADEAKHIDS